PLSLLVVRETPETVPPNLIEFLHEQYNAEILRGDTRAQDSPLKREDFANYWFNEWADVATLATEGHDGSLLDSSDWKGGYVGALRIMSNYPARSSHICHADFVTAPTIARRSALEGLGRAYLEYAAELGYAYAMFNLVFATDTEFIAALKKLGFEIIGRIPQAARVKDQEELVDAFVFGRSL
ncbi:hypothetical protein P170DRAFT_319125, partial [Aspergillus steynii IBT 23096]